MAEKQRKQTQKEQPFQEEAALELTEDTTRYGEFIPSFYGWITPEEQKVTGEKLAHLKDHPAPKS